MPGAAGISSLTLNRLSLYLRCLRDLMEQEVSTVSSQELAQLYQLSASQIRKDLAQFGEFGVRGVGYDVEKLIQRLYRALGLEKPHLLVIVGVGNLGRALAQFFNFSDESFRVVAAVDNDPEKVGQRVGKIEISDATELARIIRETRADTGVLTVPSKAAQANYDSLVAGGIKAVLNFAPVRLVCAAGVPTKTVDLRVHLEELGFLLLGT